MCTNFRFGIDNLVFTHLYFSFLQVSGHPRDCSEIQAGGVNITGVYLIYPDGDSNALYVFCDMETDGGGWTVGSNLLFITLYCFL